MNKIFKTWICLVIMWFAVLPGCKKDKTDDSKEEQQTISEAAHKPKGAPVGAAVTKTIGAGGGELSSADGLIKVIVPAGALKEDKEISIAPIVNTLNGDSLQNSYRLGPESTTFEKEVKLEFYYPPGSYQLGGDQALGIAFQRADGVWFTMPTVLDPVSKKLTVLTNHFSDWSWFDLHRIFHLPQAKSKEVIDLKLMTANILTLGPVSDSHTPRENEVYVEGYDPPDLLGVKKVGNWKIVAGPGTIQEVKDANGLAVSAKYTAPDVISKIQEVTIAVEVEGKGFVTDPSAPGGNRAVGQMILTTKLKLVPSNYAYVVFNGKTYDFLDNVNGYMNATVTGIEGNINALDLKATITILCTGSGSGEYPPGPSREPRTSDISFIYKNAEDKPKAYSSSYFNCGNPDHPVQAFSAGSVHMSLLGGTGGAAKVIEGDYNGTLYYSKTQCEKDGKRIEVRFKLNVP